MIQQQDLSPAITPCHLCGSASLSLLTTYANMARVTSDCQQWPAGGTLAVCSACHLVQTAVDSRWKAEISEIYARYSIYHQSGGVEQSVFAAAEGAGTLRSEVIIRALMEKERLAEKGGLLDLGCGNGAFLRAAAKALPGWSFSGSEWDDKYREQMERIPGFKALHLGPWEKIPGRYDVISLIHVLEHIPAPVAALEIIRGKLAPGGLLLIEVPDCLVNPYMLLIADHCSHFSVQGLRAVVESAGFEVLHSTGSWVQKEITLVARDAGAARSTPALPTQDAETILGGMRRLGRIATHARELASQASSFGIFGTSIAATWLDGQLGGAACFFVDEDPYRMNGMHLSKKIMPPTSVPEGSVVYVALPYPLCEQVAERLRRPGLEVVIPAD